MVSGSGLVGLDGGMKRAHPIVIAVEDNGDEVRGSPLLRSLLYQFQEILPIVIIFEKMHVIHDKDQRSTDLGSALKRDFLQFVERALSSISPLLYNMKLC